MSISPTAGHVHFEYLIMEAPVRFLHCDIIYPLEISKRCAETLGESKTTLLISLSLLVLVLTGSSWLTNYSVLSNENISTLPWLPSLAVGAVPATAGLSAFAGSVTISTGSGTLVSPRDVTHPCQYAMLTPSLNRLQCPSTM